MLRRFHAPPSAISGSTIRLDADETHHMRDVLRLGSNDQIHVFDGQGTEYRCAILSVDRNSTIVEILEKETKELESPIDITLCQALAKGEKFDLIVQKATELGVNTIIPVLTAYSEVRPNAESAERKVTRWRRIALEAVKQSERTRIVDVQLPISLIDALKTTADVKYFFAERGTTPIDKSSTGLAPTGKRFAIFIGPEGGWKDEEETVARENECEIVTIGPRILRTETAAIAAVSLVQYLFGDLSKRKSEKSD
jgi:16S rRNA (uracil1498-N3)-methyltransferase